MNQDLDLEKYREERFFTTQNTPFDIGKHIVYSCLSGSHAYGMATPESDVDIRGIVIPPVEFTLGMRRFEQAESTEEDVCYFSLHKFLNLAYVNGPHALEMLFVQEAQQIIVAPIVKKLFEQRHKFLSNRYSPEKYALRQLITMITKRENHTGRTALIEKYGYDTKFLAHAVRLLRMGCEAMLTGEMNIMRPDAQELLAIRNGKYTFDEAIQFERIVKPGGGNSIVITGGFIKYELDLFDDARKRSILPDNPSFEFVESLAIDMHKEAYGL